MAAILGVGVATLDIINTTSEFPQEDSKLRALSQRVTRGGNVCNSLTVLSQLGNQCVWSGTLADDNAATVILTDLSKNKIDCINCHSLSDKSSPTSYITINRRNGSRTIVHYRDLPELQLDQFTKIDFASIDCCHFEGRNIEQTILMVAHLRRHNPKIIISIEIEKPRDLIEQLYADADILFFSREYVQHSGKNSAAIFLKRKQLANTREKTILICTWGDKGAWLTTPNSDIYHQAAIPTHPLVDTLGAGDTFIAGFLHQWLIDKDARKALKFATTLAAKKCAQTGFEHLVELS